MENEVQRSTNLVLSITLIVFGALALLAQFTGVNLWRYLWPFFIILPGLCFFFFMLVGGKQAGPLAIPGSIITMVGSILLYQVITNHWASWTYAWTLIFPTSVGLGLIINGLWSGQDSLYQVGMGFLRAGVIAFLLMGVFFELLLNVSGFRATHLGGIFWSVLLIGIGVYLLTGWDRTLPSGTSSCPGEAVTEDPAKPAGQE